MQALHSQTKGEKQMNPLPKSIREAALPAAKAEYSGTDADIFLAGVEWLYSFLISRGDEQPVPEEFAWDDDVSNNNAWCDAVQVRAYIAQSLAEKAALKLKLMFAESIAQTEEQTRKHAQKEITRLRETIAVIKTQPNLAQVKILCDSALERK